MSETSNRQRSVLRHDMWKLLREVGGSDIEIERDPMGQRYKVNKFGLNVTGSIVVAQDTFDRFLALAIVHGYNVEHKGNDAYVRPKSMDATVHVQKPQAHPGGLDEAKIYIGIN